MSYIRDIYHASILLGMLILVISILASEFTFDFDLDLDFGGEVHLGILPIDFHSILFALVVFGSVGLFVLGRFGVGISLAVSSMSSIIAYQILYNLVVKPLKVNKADVLDSKDLIGKPAIVVETIHPNSSGVVMVQDNVGSKISYIASYNYNNDEEQKPISINTEVYIVDIVGNELKVARYHK